MSDLSETQTVVTRAEASAMGARHFFVGRVCVRGHIARRFTSDGSCLECRNVISIERRAGNLEKLRDQDRLRYAADPEKFKARQAKRIAANTDHVRAVKKTWYEKNQGYFKSWYAENQEEQAAKMRARRAAKPDVYATHGRNRRARVKEAEGFHCAADVQRIRAAQGNICAYCRVKLGTKGQVDHIIPLARGGSNWPSNLQLLCAPCNHSKKDRDPIEFSQSLGRLL